MSFSDIVFESLDDCASPLIYGKLELPKLIMWGAFA